MDIKTKVISSELIKPSSPTPKSLQKHNLSFLDQIAPPFMMPLVYFYPSNPIIPNSQKSIHLKKSLSETLSTFYPLAGRLIDNLHVDCNDAGTPFAEAEANCKLSQVVTNPNPKNLNKFLPYNLYHENRDICIAFKVVYFSCGGLAIGILIAHKIADALSVTFFVNSWAAAAAGGFAGVPIPKFDAAAYFPPRDITGFKPTPTTGILKEDIVTKIFFFPASKVAIIRERYSAATGRRRRPSRVEALSAFIWTRFLSATGMKDDPNKSYNVQYPVNIRSQVDRGQSELHFGNIYRLSIARPTVGDDGVELLRKVEEAMEVMNDELMDDDKYMELMRQRMAEAIKGELVSFSFTSLCGFPLYEADFGWGEPVWVGLTGFPHKNLVIFTDEKTRAGIEAVIHMRKEDMEKFEIDLKIQLLKSNL